MSAHLLPHPSHETRHRIGHQTSWRTRPGLVLLLAALAVGVVAAAPVVAERTLGASSGPMSGGGPPRFGLGGRLDERDPAIAHLDPALLTAVRAAARDARRDGVRVRIVSGWRSREHQQRLLDEAVATYGSAAEARRWVADPDSSAHVTGDAVDVGPAEGASWMAEHGAAYGLCQTFANEIWHYELATTPGGRCPQMYADSSQRG